MFRFQNMKSDDIAVKKFGDVKSISSDQYFKNENSSDVFF